MDAIQNIQAFFNHFIGNKIYEGWMQTGLKKKQQKIQKGQNVTYTVKIIHISINSTQPVTSLSLHSQFLHV